MKTNCTDQMIIKEPTINYRKYTTIKDGITQLMFNDEYKVTQRRITEPSFSNMYAEVEIGTTEPVFNNKYRAAMNVNTESTLMRCVHDL